MPDRTETELNSIQVNGETIEFAGFAVADLRPVLREAGRPAVPATVRGRFVDWLDGDHKDEIGELEEEVRRLEGAVDDANNEKAEAEAARAAFEKAAESIRDQAVTALEDVEARLAAVGLAVKTVAALKEWLCGAVSSAAAGERIEPFAQDDVV